MHSGVNLAALAEELLTLARSSSSGRQSRTLPHSGSSLRQTVLALSANSALDDHESPGSASLHVLQGSVELSTDQDTWKLSAHDLVQIPDVRHRLDATTDAVVVLTVAGQPQRP